jgi:hypothetical protein
MENSFEDESVIKDILEKHNTKYRIDKLDNFRLGKYVITKKLAGGSFG